VVGYGDCFIFVGLIEIVGLTDCWAVVRDALKVWSVGTMEGFLLHLSKKIIINHSYNIDL
jgi:hypothetical protein